MRKHTPWGAVQHHEVLAPGIISYSTAGHGGIWLDATHRKQLEDVPNWLNTPEWWEEDCDWAVPFIMFKDEIQAHGTAFNFNENLSAAWRTIEFNHKDFFKRMAA